MYRLKTPDGTILDLDQIALLSRLRSGDARPWDLVAEGDGPFIQIRGHNEFREEAGDVVVSLDTVCHRHKDRKTRARCSVCRRSYCGDCLPGPGANDALICPACDGLIEEVFTKEDKLPFYLDLGTTFLFPLRHFGIATVAGVAFLTILGLSFPPFSLVIYFFALAYIVHAIAIAAEGKEELGYGPDIDDIWHMMSRGLNAFVVTVAVALPFLLLNGFALVRLLRGGRIGLLILANLPLALVAFVYYPMALGMTAVWNNKRLPFRPDLVYEHILIIKKDYAILLLAIFLLTIVEVVLGTPLRLLLLPGHLAQSVLASYFAFVRAYMIGRTLYLRSEDLGWD